MIFVDTSFWVAQRLRSDGWHETAGELANRLAGGPLATSSAVLAETWTFLRRRADHGVAMRWLDRVRTAPHVSIQRIDADLEDRAWAWLRVHDERPYSFVDATSFALMRKLRITDALAFDGDFAAAGFVELRP